ncbi:sensor histidine kinase [Spirillospora sp. CA-294931]|uniref:sensor histidine kinase n=1 Tax=Spirillospora sp. CA-294931 TaxID=3240042 RepID=UPI003D934B96
MDFGERLGEATRAGLLTGLRGLIQAAVGLAAGVPLFVLSVVSIALMPIGVGFVLAPAALLALRGFATLQRTWASEWSGVAIPSPYRPEPDAAQLSWRRLKWLYGDPATWRDLLWSIVNIPVVMLLGLLPASLMVYGLEGVVVVPWLSQITAYGWGPFWPLEDWGAVGIVGSIALGIPLMLLGIVGGPSILKGHALFCQSLLAPTRAALARRVHVLTESRSETVDASAAELRRIERDLHDGAQARLVALSMNIGLAQELMKQDPAAAQELLSEARSASGQALTELRDLVRGIHPPVLAERGLDGAVRALALSVPLPIDVRIELPGRPDAPVESAGYFAVAEVLANIAKHSGAQRAWIQIEHRRGALVMIVGDDGIGGADPHGGSGLRGIERRLAAFDGTIAVTSPSGGPTVVTMELPCALSSPKTSPSSGTA